MPTLNVYKTFSFILGWLANWHHGVCEKFTILSLICPCPWISRKSLPTNQMHICSGDCQFRIITDSSNVFGELEVKITVRGIFVTLFNMKQIYRFCISTFYACITVTFNKTKILTKMYPKSVNTHERNFKQFTLKSQLILSTQIKKWLIHPRETVVIWKPSGSNWSTQKYIAFNSLLPQLSNETDNHQG